MDEKRKYHEIIDLTGTDVPRHKSTKIEVTINTVLFRNIPNELQQYIFYDFLQVKIIISALATNDEILRNGIRIKCAAMNQRIPRNLLISKFRMVPYILDNKIMPMFILAAKKNAVIIRTLKQNEIFEYYADGKTSNFIVLDCYEKSATVQKIRIEKYTLNIEGRNMLVVTKLSSRQNMTVKKMNERCIFSFMRHRDVCYVDKFGTLKKCVYYCNEGNIFVNKDY